MTAEWPQLHQAHVEGTFWLDHLRGCGCRLRRRPEPCRGLLELPIFPKVYRGANLQPPVIIEPSTTAGFARGSYVLSLRSMHTRLTKTDGRLERHWRRPVFQLAEVAVPKEIFGLVAERIGRLCPLPGEKLFVTSEWI